MPGEPFSPIFTDALDDPDSRWAGLRKFLERWYGRLLPRVAVDAELGELAKCVGHNVSRSVAQWMELTQAIGPVGDAMRDGRAIVYVDEIDAVSLNLQAEGDVHWAVARDHLSEPDPPVGVYVIDYVAGRFSPNPVATLPSVTLFGASYLFSYLNGESGFAVDLSDPEVDAITTALQAEGCTRGSLAGITLFEGPDWLVTIGCEVAFAIEPEFLASAQTRMMVRLRREGASLPTALDDQRKKAHSRWGRRSTTFSS